RTLFGLVTFVLLLLYMFAVWREISIVNCITTQGCLGPTLADFNDTFANITTGVGGLVSAVVITALANTRPGDPGHTPATRLLAIPADGPGRERAITVLTAIYLLVWLLTGLAALVFGGMLYPGKLQLLTDQEIK